MNVKKRKGLQMTEVVCGPKSSCYALDHVIKLGGLKIVPFVNPEGKSQKSGVALVTKIKGKNMMFAFAFCPWCGEGLQ